MADEEDVIHVQSAVITKVEAHGLKPFAEALAALLSGEFGQILRPHSDNAWYKAACGITVALIEDPINVVPGLFRDEAMRAFTIPYEKIEQITGEIIAPILKGK